MTEIILTDELKAKVPQIRLYCIECSVESAETHPLLWDQLVEKCAEISLRLKLEDISLLPAIKASRTAYKACGKDPARYRLSAEALHRRVVKGESLYRIGNIVDIINLVSITSGFSIGGYDAGKIRGTIRFGIGAKDEAYAGIGRGELNIEGLPVFRDDEGAFGSPTSDSVRTCVDINTKCFLMIIISFGDHSGLAESGEFAAGLLRRFAAANNFEINIIT
jgi:DNA/RNA-binding domain of Phe-tRNA-synthetase-like protein